LVSDEFVKMWKKVVVLYLEIVFRSLPEGGRKTTENFSSTVGNLAKIQRTFPEYMLTWFIM
jgi:hypothetical protein